MAPKKTWGQGCISSVVLVGVEKMAENFMFSVEEVAKLMHA